MGSREVVETSVTFEDKRLYDDFVGALRALKPGHGSDSLALTLLPRDFSGRARVLSVSTHYHREARLAHWSLVLEEAPSAVPPPEIRDLSERLGGLEGFIGRLETVFPGPQVTARASAAFTLDRRNNPCRFLPKPGPAPTGAERATQTASWRFPSSQPQRWLTLVSEAGASDYLARVELELQLAVSPAMFAATEEIAWNALGKFLAKRRRRGT